MRADDDAAIVLDIVTAAREAQDFVRELDLERFRADAKTSSAVLYKMMIIGEAAKKHSNRSSRSGDLRPTEERAGAGAPARWE